MSKNIWYSLILIIICISTEMRASDKKEVDVGQEILAQMQLLTPMATDIILGSADAKLTLIEYSSLTCHHCATFHKDVFPELNKRFIETGKLKYIQRSFPIGKPAVDAAVFLKCVDTERYYLFLKVLFEKQENWATNRKYLEVIENIAKLGGISGEKFHQCIENTTLQNMVAEGRLQAQKTLKINSTPTFYLNGEKFVGAIDMSTMVDLITKELNKIE